MVLNLFKLVNFSTSTVTVKNSANSSDNFTVKPQESNGHDMWLGGDVSHGVEVCVLFGPMETKCYLLLWDKDWNIQILTGTGTSAIPVNGNKDFSINFFPEYAVFECFNGTFKDGVSKVKMFYDGRDAAACDDGDEMTAVVTPFERVDIMDAISGPSSSVV